MAGPRGANEIGSQPAEMYAAATNEGNSDELERHIIKRFEIQERLGKGVRRSRYAA